MCIIVTNLFWFAEMLFLSFAEMAIITLTSDLGFRDHYAAIVKGAIATAVPNASIIDISHNIAAFDITLSDNTFNDINNVFKAYPMGF